MFGRSISLYYEDAISWDVYIRLSFYEGMQTENEKLSLSHLLSQYFDDRKVHLKQFKARFRRPISTNFFGPV